MSTPGCRGQPCSIRDAAGGLDIKMGTTSPDNTSLKVSISLHWSIGVWWSKSPWKLISRYLLYWGSICSYVSRFQNGRNANTFLRANSKSFSCEFFISSNWKNMKNLQSLWILLAIHTGHSYISILQKYHLSQHWLDSWEDKLEWSCINSGLPPCPLHPGKKKLGLFRL